jgi:hypothetical protein
VAQAQVLVLVLVQVLVPWAFSIKVMIPWLAVAVFCLAQNIY